MLREEKHYGYLMVFPALAILLALIAYPLFYSIVLAFSDKKLGSPLHFIGLQNFVYLIKWSTFRTTLFNTLFYTICAVALKTGLGLVLALILFRTRKFQRFYRAIVLIPWAMPAAFVTLSWTWMLQPGYSVINWVFIHLNIIKRGIPWLEFPSYARLAVIIVNTWRGLPFFAITFLAGLVGIPQDLIDAAKVDGAGPVARFWYITLPMLVPLLSVVVLFSTMMTIGDFDIVYVLTGGGPFDTTHLLATLAYTRAIGVGQIGMGA